MALAVALAAQVALIAICDRIDRGRREPRFPVTMESRSEPAHDLIVERPDGSRVDVPAVSGGFQLVHFWATWCPPCRDELPMLLGMAHRHGRLRVWAISVDEEWATVRSFFDGQVPSAVVRDVDGTGHRLYGVMVLPESYLVDSRGRIRARFAGAQQWTSPRMDQLLKRLLSGS